jgi:hypothetical protein
MEKRFKSLSLFEFQSQFPNDESCTKYLAELKWSNGFKCVKCGNDKFCVGNKAYDRQCTRCNHGESPTAGTLFHKSKLPILKAFYIIYYLATTKNGISSTELAENLPCVRRRAGFLSRRRPPRGYESYGEQPKFSDGRQGRCGRNICRWSG